MNALPHRIGIYFALLQLFFALSWTVYAIYLPQLAAAAGLATSAVIVLLMLDQAIFMIADFATGIASDRVSRLIGRIGYWIGAVALISCLAFLALPFIAPAGTAVFMAVAALWAVTSSALRAPPLTLLGKYAAKPALPYLASLTMLGYGVAGAVSPYLAVTLRNVDPRIPFALASLAVVLTAFGLTHVERLLAKQNDRQPVSPAKFANISWPAAMFALALVVLGLGYQLHFSINSGPLYLRFAQASDLEWLMPVFWIGFNVAMVPASMLAKRFGAYSLISIGSLVGGLAILAAIFAPSLEGSVVAQFITGAAWGIILVSAFNLAVVIGGDGREGAVIGLLLSMLAAATLARMAIVAAGFPGNATLKIALQWAPVACWAIAGSALLLVTMSPLLRRLEPRRR